MPRVSYLNNSNGSLILEPQRSNINTYSSDYTVTTALTRITVSSDYGTSPSGLSDSTAIFNTATNGRHNIGGNYFSVTSGTSYVNSVFAKAGTLSKINLRMFSGGGTSIGFNDGTFDLINGTASGIGASIEDYGNGWYRCIVVDSPTSSVSNARFNIELLDNNGSVSYLGSTDEYVEIYGSQVESGSYATTLINTSGSSVTRNADVCSISNVADRIGQTEGVFYWEGENIGEQFAPYLGLFADAPNTNSTRVMIYYTSETTLNTQVRLNGVIQFTSGNATANGRVKVALAYKENDFVLYVNGSKISESSSGSTFTNELNNFNFNSAICKNYDLKIYNTRLSNSELATLTTL